MTTDRPDPSAPIPEDRLPAAVFAITCGALGYPRGVVPPPPVGAFATAMRSAVEAMLAAPKDNRGNAPGDPLRKASAGAVFAAVASLARNGLLPGIPGTPATGYLYAQNNVLTGRPSPLGRVRMACQGGADVETTAVGKSCRLEMGQDGLVSLFERDPDNVPRRWEDLRGVVVSVTSHASGLLKMHWVSAGEIGDRRARSKQPNGGAWASDPVTMARTKALAIIGDRGGFPQAPIPIPGLREWQAAQAALPAHPPAIPAPPARAMPAPAEEPRHDCDADGCDGSGTDCHDDGYPVPAEARARQIIEEARAEGDARPHAYWTGRVGSPCPYKPGTVDAELWQLGRADFEELVAAGVLRPMEPEPPQAPQDEAAALAREMHPTWNDAWRLLCATPQGAAANSDDLSTAFFGAASEACATAAVKGSPLTTADALAPKAQARLVELALDRLRSM